MIDIPDFHPLKITQSPRAPARHVLDGLDHLAIVVPEKPGEALFRTLPHGQQLAKLVDHAHRHDATTVSTRLTNERATGITLATFAEGKVFDTLKAARDLIVHCTRESPSRLGLFVCGFGDEARTALLKQLVSAAAASAFEMPSLKSRPNRRTGRLRQLTLLGISSRLDISDCEAEALGNNVARWFTALPPNLGSAPKYRDAIRTLADQHGLAFRFFDEEKLSELGAGAFLAVSQGNADREAGIIHLSYTPGNGKNGTPERPDVALIGKGIVFDTGGNNLKPFKSMLDMHTDMQGSSVALGTLLALAALKVPYRVDAWLAVTENRISATAYKSQDVVRALNGTTIQVIHTDAEGRMVLADTLALAAQTRPGVMIDYATLTGTCVHALTDRYSGVFSNRDTAHQLLISTGRACGERVWPFPMDKDFDEALKSDIADIMQCSPDGAGDHILAARFLSRFVPDAIPWIHMDLSAAHRKGGLAHIPSNATGFGVRFTLELLHRQCGSAAELAQRLEQPH
jgi:leucyl aminopeptidase